MELVKRLGVNIKTGITVGATISVDELLLKHDAIFIGIGLGESPALNIPGEELMGVERAISFIKNLKNEDWSSVAVGKRVAVIGAGPVPEGAGPERRVTYTRLLTFSTSTVGRTESAGIKLKRTLSSS